MARANKGHEPLSGKAVEKSWARIARIEETNSTGGKETSILGTEIFKHRVCTGYEEGIYYYSIDLDNAFNYRSE